MSYATQADLVERFDQNQLLELADRDGDGTLDTDVVSRALADADAEIDVWIGKVHDLPLPSVPPRLVTVACDIAFYRLHPAAPSPDARQRYEDAIAFLRAVAEGRAVLDAGGSPPPPAGDGVSHSAPDRVFTRDRLDAFEGFR